MDDDANLLRAEVRNMIGANMMLTIQVGKFGAVICDDDTEEHGYYVVEWVGVPWTDQKTHQLMCDVLWWDKTPNTKHWHTRGDPSSETDTVEVNHVVLGDLSLHGISP